MQGVYLGLHEPIAFPLRDVFAEKLPQQTFDKSSRKGKAKAKGPDPTRAERRNDEVRTTPAE